MSVVLAIDAGTTGVRTLGFDQSGTLVDSAYLPLDQNYPHPGWVEHDPMQIWSHVASTISEVAARQTARGQTIAAIGVTNQRETLVAWRTSTGQPVANAIVWQDRRTSQICDELREQGHEPFVRERTGLILDPYFTATKMHWLLSDQGGHAVEVTDDLVMSTVDAWVAWNLTGGSDGGVLATDATNAGRTLLYDIRERQWSAELCDLFGIPQSVLPAVVPSCGRVATVSGDLASTALKGVPLSAMAGDQHAALFGQACFKPGMAKVTNGTGSFVLLNHGPEVPDPVSGVLTTVGWDLGSHGGESPFVYALEGSVFVTGAAVQWLRDGLGIISDSSDMDDLAASVADTEGVYIVPAFTGLGSPWWDPHARGAIFGLTRGVGRGHMARAVIESMAFQVRDVIEAMTDAAGTNRSLRGLRVDGGASVSDLLLQMQADQLQFPVSRPTTTETTAFGAASLAGLAEGVWGSLEELSSLWHLESEFAPRMSRGAADAKHQGWVRAVERSGHWA